MPWPMMMSVLTPRGPVVSKHAAGRVGQKRKPRRNRRKR